MDRIDPEMLADHLEAALACTALNSIEALCATDPIRRHKAIRVLAIRLAGRLQLAGSQMQSERVTGADLFA
jgi:hypothetical protein